MEVRQVQRTGGTTFAITLPKKWALRQGLKAGESVGILAESDGSLRVVHLRGAPEEKRRIVIDATGLEGDALARRVVGAYLVGFDIIQVEAKPQLGVGQKETVRRIATRLVGPQIVEETDAAVLLEDLLDPKDFSLMRGLRRIHTLVRGMVQDALGVVTSRNAGIVRDLRNRDDEIDRLQWLVFKQYYLILQDPLVGMKLGLDPKGAVGTLLVARLLERIGDHAELIGSRALALEAPKVPADIVDRMVELGTVAVRIIDDAFQALLEADPAAADRAVERTHAFRELHAKALQRATLLEGGAGVSLALLLESIDRMVAHATGIAEMATNAHLLRSGAAAGAP